MLRAQLFRLSTRIYGIVALALLLAAILAQTLLSQGANHAYALRQEHLGEIIDTALSTLTTLDAAVESGEMSLADAQDEGARLVSSLRFGESGYFFGFDHDLNMVMHATLPDWVGTNKATYLDAKGTAIFVEMRKIVDATDRGSLTYYFQKPDAKTPEPKIGYVAEFAPWGWIIGTGAYVSDIEAEIAASRRLGFGALGVFLVILVGVSALLIKSVTTPLADIRKRMTQLAEGDTDAPVPHVNAQSEVGAMAKGVEVFRLALAERARLEQAQVAKDAEIAQQREAAAAAAAATAAQKAADDKERRDGEARARAEREAEQARIAQERAENLREQENIVDALAKGLGAMSNGDLTARLVDPFPPAYEKLRADFNNAVDRISGLVATITEGVTSILAETDTLNGAALDLGRRTETQAASLEETAAAITQLAATVEAAATSARQAAGTVSNAKHRSTEGRAVVESTIKAIHDIADSSTRISKITDVIEDIAFQTNLLALNAGVEAARAGESGRGFAVVASEVRALAQRSSDAAREIAGLIETSGTQVENGVKLVTKSGEALSEIETLIGGLDKIVQSMAISADEQSAGIAEINSAVNQLDQVTQHNAAMFEETTAALQSLKKQAEALADNSAQLRTTDMPLRMAS